MTTLTLKELVQQKNRVQFIMYRKGELHYEVYDSENVLLLQLFRFVVPIDDCGDGEFLVDDKAMLFMRYIRKQLDANKAAQDAELKQPDSWNNPAISHLV